jgi:hypothetical protein
MARVTLLPHEQRARRMIKRGSGVILMHTPEPAALGVPHMGGMSPAWAAMEALSPWLKGAAWSGVTRRR